MAYYVFIQNEKINGTGQCKNLTEGVLNIEVEEDIYNNIEKYIYLNGEIVLNPNYEAEQARKERERLNLLSMTRGDMFEAIILAFGKTKADIRSMIENVEGLTDIERALYLNRFDEALDFYRGYPAVDLIGKMLGVSSEQLDKFFETKDYHYLTTCKLTINPTPANATVTIEPNPTPYGETTHYRVECEGYVTKEGDIEMIKDEVLEIVLDENTTNTAE